MNAIATYTPQAGTIAARVLAHLRALDADVMQSSNVIADALDCDPGIEPYMRLAHEHGLVAREKRDGRWWWGIGHPKLRPLAGPAAVSADDDDVDDAPIVQRTVPATRSSGISLVDTPAWSPPASKDSVMDKPTPPQPTKKTRATAPAFDPLTIEVKKDRPLPPVVPGSVSRYKALLERLQPGDSVDLPTTVAKSLVSTAKKLNIKIAVRAISAEVSGVWRL
jgi:hypothetical protein